METATNDVHAHEVLSMMLTSDTPFTRESLVATIEQKFGRDARFYTCSSSNLTANELVDFFESRGKFVRRSDGFNVDPQNVCSH